ncbi:MAG: Flp pilus assembly protein TadG [Paraglaciecola sp.]|jgi:Flp pilus assembly protein TadG
MHTSNNCPGQTKTHQKEKGLAAIELTIILPFVLLLIFATAEFGRLLYQYNALNKTVRDATRYLMSNARASTGQLAITSTVNANVAKLVKYGDLTSATPLLPNLAASSVGISVSGDFVTINVSYPWQPLFSDAFTSFGFGSDIDISFPLVSTYTMRVL